MSDLERQFFPAWHLGYRCNPFRALTRVEWRDLAVLPTELLAQPYSLPNLTQLLGEEGRGKTSILLALEREIKQCGSSVAYEYLPPGAQRYTQDLNGLQVFLLDEAQRLSRRSLNSLLEKISTSSNPRLKLIISSHIDLSAHYEQHGISAETLSLAEPSSEWVRSLIELRLCYFERPGHPGVRLAPNAKRTLISYCGSDLRLLEKLLYEAYQTWVARDPITETHIRGLMEDND